VRTAKGGNAPELSPLIVRYPQLAAPRPASNAAERFAAPAQDIASLRGDQPAGSGQNQDALGRLRDAREADATIETGGYQVVFRIPGRITVATNEGAKSFRVATAKIAPDLLSRATPSLDETAYLEASFKQADEAALLPGRVALYRDGIFVGRGQVALTPKDETVRLGFGADDKVKVARATVRRIEGSTGIISSAKTDEREYKITVRSGHERPIRVVVEDQVPTSEIEDIKVELLPVTTAPTERDVRDRRGVLAWSFDAAPGEAKEIKLGWRIRWPADKLVSYEPRRP
jgi:uncharacterized protein (TIGR02231 family)